MGSSREAHVKSLIRRRYAHLAVSATAASDGRSRALAAGYRPSSLDRVPQALVRIWSGCGALAEHLDLDGVGTVVDVGCGGGLDACLLANRDPPPRHIVAVDLTPEMLTVFGEHLPGAPRCRVSRVGSDAEHLPLTDACCDLVVANAAFNLALDMASAIAESARILRPGGRFEACELVREGELSAELLADPLGHATSLGGVPREEQLLAAIAAAGLVDVRIEGHRPFPPVAAVTVRAQKPL